MFLALHPFLSSSRLTSLLSPSLKLILLSVLRGRFYLRRYISSRRQYSQQNWTRSRTGRRDLRIWRRSHNLSYFERVIIATKARCPPHQVSWYDNLPYPSPPSHILLIYTCRTRNNKCWIRRDFIQRPYLSWRVMLCR